MLREHVERAGAQRRSVLRMLGDRVDGDAAFQHLEAVGRHQDAARGLFQPVIGAADALQEPRRALRRADIDDEIDVAPVDAEIERGGADHRAQPAARHGRLDLAALRHVERAVMERDREPVVVDAPQRVEDHLRLAARVDEHERHLVLPDQLVDRRERVARGMAGPGQALAGLQHGDLRLGAAVGDDEIGARLAVRRLRHQEAAEVLGIGHGRRQPDRGQLPARGETSRASPSASRSPRFDMTSECNSSSTTRLSVPNR